MRASESPVEASWPKGPTPKRVESQVQWQPLAEVSYPLPEQFAVHLREGKHPKTGAPQWFGFYTHGRETLKVVCDPYSGHELPKGGEVWEVIVTKQIPGIVFAKAETSPALVQRIAEQLAKEAAELAAFRLRALDQRIELSIFVPVDPQDHEPEVWNRVDHYTGKLVRWEKMAEGTIEVELVDVYHRRSQTDIEEGRFEGHMKSLDGRKTFQLHGGTVEDRPWYDHESGERGSYRALCGSNPGRSDWDAKQWWLSVVY